MSARRLVSLAVFSALIAVGGLISVPVPFTQIEVSLQTLFVIMAGVLLGGRDGALSSLVYIAMGLLGLPVFTQGGGVAYVFKPSFGYLIGFPVGALVSGAICSSGKTCGPRRVFLSALVGLVPIYAFGISYQLIILRYYMGSTTAAAVAGLPAIGVMAVKDGAMCGLIAALYPSLNRALGYRRRKKQPPASAVKQDIK